MSPSKSPMLRRVVAALLVLALAAIGIFWAWGLHTPDFPQPALTGKVEQRRLDVGGLGRSFLVYIPQQLPDSVPVVLVMHGSGGSAARMRSDTAWAFEQLADREGMLVVYPDAFEGQWNDCRATGDFAARQRAVDDVAFLRAVVARLNGDPVLGARQIDADAVFAAGLSNGGHMALRLALEAPDLVSGVAAIAASLPAVANSLCRPAGQPVPVLLINGDADPVSPYGGGEIWSIGAFNRRGLVQSSRASAQYFSALAGYTEPPFEHRFPDSDAGDDTVATRTVWSAGDRAEVGLITIHGGGHTIPHPVKTMPRILGRTSHDVPAAEEVWRFFRRQLLTGGTPE